MYSLFKYVDKRKNSIEFSTAENPLGSVSALDDRATILTFKQSEKMQIQARFPGREVYTIVLFY